MRRFLRHCEEHQGRSNPTEDKDCFAALLRNKILNPYHSLDSSFRWNDEDDTPVISGKAVGRDPESKSLLFLPLRLASALWKTRNDTCI